MKRLILTLILVSVVGVEALTLKQSSTQEHLVFLMVDSTDHVTAKTGLSPTVTLSKNAAAFGSPAGAVTEIANGWYKVAGNATDTNTLGTLILHATGTAADPADIIYEVVAYDPQSATTLGLTNLDAAVSSRMATYTQPTGFLSATFPSGTIANTTNITAGTMTTTTNLTTNNDKTGYSLTVTPPTAATIASAVWQDTTAGDFTTALSVGKSVMNGVTLGTGLTINGYTGNTPQTGDAYARIGVAGAGLTALGDTRIANLDGTVTSRMATYTQPTGFLAATFPSGTIANTTNITAGTIATVTTLTNLPSIPANWLTAAGIAANALNGKGDWLLSSGYTAPPSAATISDSVWDEVLSGHLTGGTTGAALNGASSADDPWSIVLPGSYTGQEAGNLLWRTANKP